MDDIRQKLQEIGFSEKEAAVYVALLQAGRSGVNKVATQAQVNRATTYSVLKSLIEKGLVTESQVIDDKQYRAESPEVLLSILSMQQRDLNQRLQSTRQVVDRLQAFHNLQPKKPKIRYIESLDGLRLIQAEYQKMEHEILQLVGYDTFVQLYGDQVGSEHEDSLIDQQRKIRAILVTDQEIKYEAPSIEIARVSPDLFEVRGEMTVCGDRLALFAYAENLIAIEIQSAVIAATARASLELAWREAQRLSNG